ncbi:hypothetical protein C1H46_044294 [Malus baccata]|uniref:Protein kinase domain-containing protein n=1 Tax=Malus baccata TaxID=106549 RepID=A0A540K7H6_MALBA|nr:hypothetical protein C1H46_044294 [Malus baccata]
MGCVISREASSGVNSESKGGRRDLSVESTGKVDAVVVPKVDSKTADVHVGGGEGKKEENVHGGEKPPRGERRRSKPNPRSGNVPKQSRGAQVAAGWPPWLTEACGEALNGWIPRKADTFEKIDKIGSGTYSNVYKAKDMLTGKIVALKKVRFDNLEPESVRFMAREILILRRLDHINVVKLEGLVTSRMSCSLYLVLEYMEHDLAGLAASPEIKFTEPQRRRLITHANAKSKSEKFPPPHQDGAVGYPLGSSHHFDPALVPPDVPFSTTSFSYPKESLQAWSGPLVEPASAGGPRRKKHTGLDGRETSKSYTGNLREKHDNARVKGKRSAA